MTIRSFVKSITKTSFFMNQIITKNNEVIVEAQIHLVFVNKDGKPKKMIRFTQNLNHTFVIVLRSS